MLFAEQEALELRLLLEAIYGKYGYDFRQYSQAFVKRRVLHYLESTEHAHISELIPLILYNEDAFQSLFFNMSVTVTEMFRDPWLYNELRTHVVPFLQTYPYLNIWYAGCATGEEVFSLAIFLKEEGLYKKTHIYATDFNDKALTQAKSRIYPLEPMKLYSQNYQKAGGNASLSDYYLAQYDSVIFNHDLLDNVTFANHNLTTDSAFGNMHLIICRNVMIYFNSTLQSKVFQMFHDSLIHQGFLCLGSKETLQFSKVNNAFDKISDAGRIYQSKKRRGVE